MGTGAQLRTIVECEQMLSCIVRCARNKRDAWTRSLGFNGDVWLLNSKSRMGRTQNDASEKRINHAITPLALLYDA